MVLALCNVQPYFCDHRGNRGVYHKSKIFEKIVGPYHYKITTVVQQYLTPSGPKGAQKYAFPDFHGNASEIENSDSARLLSDPKSLSMPNFVTIGQEMAEEIAIEKSV